MKLQTENENRYVYRIPPVSRIPYILFAGIVILGFFSAPGDEIFSLNSILPLLLFFVSLFGLGYRDTWIFDGEALQVVQLSGVFVFLYEESNSIHFETCQSF